MGLYGAWRVIKLGRGRKTRLKVKMYSMEQAPSEVIKADVWFMAEESQAFHGD